MRSRRRIVLGAAALACGLVGLTYVLWPESPPPPPLSEAFEQIRIGMHEDEIERLMAPWPTNHDCVFALGNDVITWEGRFNGDLHRVTVDSKDFHDNPAYSNSLVGRLQARIIARTVSSIHVTEATTLWRDTATG